MTSSPPRATPVEPPHPGKAAASGGPAAASGGPAQARAPQASRRAAAPLPTPAIDRVVARLRARARLADLVWASSAVVMPSALALAAIAVAAHRRELAPLALAWVAAVPLAAAIAWAWLRPRRERALLRQLDAHLDTHDLLGNAWELARAAAAHGASAPSAAQPSGESDRSAAIIRALVAAGEARASTTDPRPAIALRWQRPGRYDLAALALLALAALVPPPQPQTSPPRGAPVVPGASTPREAPRRSVDLALAEPLRQDLRGLADSDDEAGRAAKAMLEVLAGLERGELDRAAALAQLEALSDALDRAAAEFEAGLEEDPGLLGEGMRELGKALQDTELTAEAGRELERGDPEAFEAAFDEALAQAGNDTAAADQLERALDQAQRALQRSAQSSSDTARELAEAERRLKRQQQRPEADPEEQERRLKRQRERVDALRRQHEREAAAQRKLDALRRQAREARGSERGSSQRQQAGQKLGQGAKSASASARKSQRLSRASDDVQEAMTLVRKAGRGSESDRTRESQMKRFSKAAKGQRKPGEPTLLVEGDVGDGDPEMLLEGEGQGDSQGDGQGDAQGAGDGEGEGQGDGDGDGDGQGQGDAQGAAGSGLGDGQGEGSSEALGDPTGLDVRTRDVRVDARAGKGATRAEVIRTASQQGFASEAYRDRYQEYRDFAHASMDDETVPAPARRRVQRYFKMIQPR